MKPYLGADNLKPHTLSSGTHLYSPYMGVPLPLLVFTLQQQMYMFQISSWPALTMDMI